ncbi:MULTISPECIES: hypothetical protein [Methanoculleus]|jgi:hypothetical protein|uniref:hypothetical protein n=1 Tax=Methanoculleus TaxID=45989 RepID=UPI0022ED929C|nr:MULTISPECIES: hypothetical protein [Methanoculleus]GLI45774.1 hypothetical protein MBOURGENBZM_05660 [Methanoculleus bourgensis]
MKNDEAVSTVIAMMLILGIIATLIAIYSATYLPGLKQQSEIEHSRDVANAFVRFGSDIDYVVSQKKAARFSEPFSLGGGDVLLSPVRSSGLVTIGEERPLVDVTVTNQTGERMTGNVSLVDVSYVPSFTTWEPQGYRWEYGFVAVTKDNVTVPQSSGYNTMDEALGKRGVEFLGSVIDLNPSGANLEITATNLTRKEDEFYITGSGIATIEVNATTLPKLSLDEVTEIVFEDLIADGGVPGMKEILKEKCEEVERKGVGATYIPPGEGESSHKLTFTSSMTVTLRIVNVEVSVC